jgi:hypothetical protein
MIPNTTGLLDASPMLSNLVGGSSSNDTDVSTTATDDPNSGTEFGQEGDDYYGQSGLDDLYTPTLDDPAIDDDGYQGEDSWMDYDEDDTDGAGSRYDRETPWTTDVALQFDTGVVDDLTVPDLEFTDEQRDAFSAPGQTLDDIASDVQQSLSDGVEATPAEDVPDGFEQGDPGIVLQQPSGGTPSWVYAAGAAVVAAVLAIALGRDGSEGDDG